MLPSLPLPRNQTGSTKQKNSNLLFLLGTPVGNYRTNLLLERLSILHNNGLVLFRLAASLRAPPMRRARPSASEGRGYDAPRSRHTKPRQFMARPWVSADLKNVVIFPSPLPTTRNSSSKCAAILINDQSRSCLCPPLILVTSLGHMLSM